MSMEGPPPPLPPPPPPEPPKPEESPDRNQEGNDPVYEEILGAAKALREQKVNPFAQEDYTKSKNPVFVAAMDRIQDWEAAQGLGAQPITTPEKARTMVRAAMLWIDAGYASKIALTVAQERLVVEKLLTERNTENAAVRGILSSAVNDLEVMLTGKTREKNAVLLIKKAMIEAHEKMAAEDFMDATRLLSSVLSPTNDKFKDYFLANPEKRAEVKALQDTARAEMNRQWEERKKAKESNPS